MSDLPTQHPRLFKKCLDLTGDSDAAKVLCLLVVQTAEHKGAGGVVFEDGHGISLPRHIRKMKLHELVGVVN